MLAELFILLCTLVTSDGFRASYSHCRAITVLRDMNTIETVNSVSQSIGDQSVMQDTVAYTIESFNGAIRSKFIGFVVGNFLAGVAVKVAADAINALKNTYVKDEKVAETKKPEVNASSWGLLALCVFIDLVGDGSYALPGVGELEDVVWAPLSAYALSQIFGSNIITTIDFLKEILPGTDILPVASLAWLLQNFYPFSPITSALGISPRRETATNATEELKSK